MRVFLPPSESKAEVARGRAIDLDSLTFAGVPGHGLTSARHDVLTALTKVSSAPDALEVLDAPAGAAAVVEAQRDVFDLPTTEARRLYTGVLFDALSIATLDGPATRRATARVRISSAAFGAVRLTDRLPPYRLSMGVDLPGIGPLAPFWRNALAGPLGDDTDGHLVVDLRSSTYVASWRPDRANVRDWVAVHVVRDGPEGRTAVSHMAKHTRGLVARHLLATGASPRTAEDLADALTPAFSVVLHETPRRGARRLDVVEPA